MRRWQCIVINLWLIGIAACTLGGQERFAFCRKIAVKPSWCSRLARTLRKATA